MIKATVVFLIIALITGLFSFLDTSHFINDISEILFGIFIFLFFVSLIFGKRGNL